MDAQLRAEKECPWCAELILEKAIVCKHCGRDIERDGRDEPRHADGDTRNSPQKLPSAGSSVGLDTLASRFAQKASAVRLKWKVLVPLKRALAAVVSIGIVTGFFLLDLANSVPAAPSSHFTLMLGFAGAGVYASRRGYTGSNHRMRRTFIYAAGTCFAISVIRSFSFLARASAVGIFGEVALNALMALIAATAVLSGMFAFGFARD